MCVRFGQALREVARDRSRAATCVELGPRVRGGPVLFCQRVVDLRITTGLRRLDELGRDAEALEHRRREALWSRARSRRPGRVVRGAGAGAGDQLAVQALTRRDDRD